MGFLRLLPILKKTFTPSLRLLPLVPFLRFLTHILLCLLLGEEFPMARMNGEQRRLFHLHPE